MTQCDGLVRSSMVQMALKSHKQREISVSEGTCGNNPLYD